MLGNTYNPSLSGGREGKEQLKASPGRKSAGSYLKTKLAYMMVAYTCNPSYSGSRGRRITV
jgi:hypothetical protein